MIFSFKRTLYLTCIFSALFNSNLHASSNTFPRCIYSQIFIENHNNKEVFSVNLFQFNMYKLNNFTKKEKEIILNIPRNKYSTYIIPKGSIAKTNPTEIYSIYIEKQRSIDYYIGLLDILMDNNTELNTRISTNKNNDQEMDKMLNYAPPYKIKIMFGVFLDNIIDEMTNSDSIKKYNLNNKIIQFKNACIEYDDSSDKIKDILCQFKYSIKENISK